MKNRLRYLVLILAMSSIFTSCESWLGDTPKSQVPEENQFKTVTGFQQVLTGCYLAMTDNMLYGKNLSWHIIEIMGQQYTINTTGLSNSGYQASIYSFKGTKMLPQTEGIWAKAYNAIVNINNALKFIEKNRSVLDDINYGVIKGELLAMRAYLHFDLMRLYGYGNLPNRSDAATDLTVPYLTGVSKNIAEQLTYEETLALIIADLKDAIKLLEADPLTGKYDASYYTELNLDGFFNKRNQRFNYFATKALLARVCMWEGSAASKTLALETALEVINDGASRGIYRWATNTTAQSDPLLTTEHLVCLEVSKVKDRLAGYFMISPHDTNYEALVLKQSHADLVYEVAAGVAASDFRYTDMLFANPEINSRTSTKYLSAAMNTSTTNKDKANVPLIRIPEMYYIASECYATSATPNLTNALKYLNDVRRNRGIYIDLADLDAAGVVAEIQKEYAKEFLCEGVMFYYYKRLGILDIPDYASTMDDSKYMMTYPDLEIQSGRVQMGRP